MPRKKKTKKTKRKTTKRKVAKRKTTKRKTTKREVAKRKVAKRKTIKRKTTKRKVAKRKVAKRKTTKRKAAKRKPPRRKLPKRKPPKSKAPKRKALDVKRKPKKKTPRAKARERIIKEKLAEKARKKRRKKVAPPKPAPDRKVSPKKTVKLTGRKTRKRVKDWVAEIRGALETTARAIGYENYIGKNFPVVWRNSDGSVDGELRIPVPKNVSARTIMRDLSQQAVIPPRTWFTLGGAYVPKAIDKDDRDRYRMFAGMMDVTTSYGYSGDSKYVGEYFANALVLLDDMESVHGTVATDIILRINWNSPDVKPEPIQD